MKLLALSILSVCSFFATAQTDTIFHEIPVNFHKTKAPFANGVGVAFPQRRDVDFRYERNFKALPVGWTKEETFFAFDILDFNQHVYQKHLFGELDDSVFAFMQEFHERLNFNDVVDRDVACMMYIAYRTEGGCIELALDANANLDFSDDEIHEMCAPNRHLNPEAKREILELPYRYEYVHGGEVIEDTLTVMLSVDSSRVGPNMSLLGLMNATYGYGEFFFEEDTVYVKSNIAGNSLTPFASLFVSPNIGYEENAYVGDFVKVNGRILEYSAVLNNPARIQLRELVAGERPQSAKVGFYLPSFGGVNELTGDSVSTTDYRGKYLYIDIWGSWCVGCVIDLPNLVNSYSEMDKSVVDVIGVAYDVPENLQEAVQEYGITWPNVLNSEENNITELLNVNGFPTTILVNPEGVVIATGLRGENLNEQIQIEIEKDQAGDEL